MLTLPRRPLATVEEINRYLCDLVPQLERRIIENVAVATTSTAIAHGLTQTPRFYSWTPVSPGIAAIVWVESPADSKCIYLRSSVAVTVTIEVVP